MGTWIVRASVTIGVVSIGAARDERRGDAAGETLGVRVDDGTPCVRVAVFPRGDAPGSRRPGSPGGSTRVGRCARSTDRRNGPTQSVATARLLGPVTVGWMPKFATIATPSKTRIDADGVSACPRRFIATSAGRGVRTNRAGSAASAATARRAASAARSTSRSRRPSGTGQPIASVPVSALGSGVHVRAGGQHRGGRRIEHLGDRGADRIGVSRVIASRSQVTSAARASTVLDDEDADFEVVVHRRRRVAAVAVAREVHRELGCDHCVRESGAHGGLRLSTAGRVVRPCGPRPRPLRSPRR